MVPFRIEGATPDRYWLALAYFLDDRFGSDARIVVPDPLIAGYASGIRPADSAGVPFDTIAAIIIHKGDFAAFPADVLHLALASLQPVFANEVFVVLAPQDPDRAAQVDGDHLGPLAAIRVWARARADPALVARTAAASTAWLEPGDLLARMARLITRDLVRTVPDSQAVAVAETAVPFEGSNWFWGDDAAKVAELFCLPSLHREQAEMAGRLIDFILSLSPGSIIHRRSGPPGLTLHSDDAADFRVSGPFTITFGDLTRGRILQSMRFNDGRTRPLVAFTPGTLSFTWRGQSHSVDLSDATCAHAIEQRDDGIMLYHLSSIRCPGNVSRELATVAYTHALHPGRSAIHTEVTVRPTRFAALRDVVVSHGAEELGDHGNFDRITLLSEGGAATTHAAEQAIGPWKQDGSTGLVSIWEAGAIPGHAVGIHIAPDRAAPASIAPETVAGDGGRLAALRLRYDRPRVTSRKPLTLGEERLVTVGGYYKRADEYLELTRDRPAAAWCHDASMSYDTGVELNAVATYLFFAIGGHYGRMISADRIATLHDWFDRHLKLYLDHIGSGGPGGHERIFVRGLAFVILAIDVAARVFPDGGYAETADRLTDMLLDMQVPLRGAPDAALFSNAASDAAVRPELDSQGATLLALARRACTKGPDPRLSDAIAGGLNAMQVGVPGASSYGNAPLNHATILLARNRSDAELADTGYWTYKLGLSLRAFEAITVGVAMGRIDLSDAVRAHLDNLRRTARTAVGWATIDRGEAIEILTSAHAGETNSETQPWVAMGLVPDIDRALAGLPPAAGPEFVFALN